MRLYYKSFGTEWDYLKIHLLLPFVQKVEQPTFDEDSETSYTVEFNTYIRYKKVSYFWCLGIAFLGFGLLIVRQDGF